jgi:tripartite-type tricarboxylate transporter receptor subunit TctC
MKSSCEASTTPNDRANRVLRWVTRSGRRQRRGPIAALLTALLAALLDTMVTDAAAQAYPTHPVHLVVPYAAGGGVDLVARLVAEQISGPLGQPVIVDNKPGAGSNVGANYVAKAAADGYTLLMASPASAINVTLYKNMPFDTVRDLVPVVLVGEVPSVLIVNPDVKAATLAQFVALAKSEPGKLTYGSGGVGASEHLAGALFASQAGIEMQHVPYRGGSGAINDLIGGQISAIIINQLAALPFIKSGKVRALAVAGRERSPELPDVPTFVEAGYPNFQIAVWWGVMAPAATPAAIVDRLNREVNSALARPVVQERLKAMGARPIGGSATQFHAFVDDEIKRWGRAVQLTGATVE